MRLDDLAQLKDDLVNYRADLESGPLRAELVEACLPRLLATLEMIPDDAGKGDLLELGATPFFLTLCLRRLCRGHIALANWFGTADKQGEQRLTHARTGEELRLRYDLFNIETETFPYPDERFDVVVFSELIEHLGVNPVRTLAEIHRVLKPQGYVIVTTPNALSLDRFATFLTGGSQMVDRYSPLFGYGARHNREYHPRELRELLEETGFKIEDLAVRDLVPHGAKERLRRRYWAFALSFLLAREAPRHWLARLKNLVGVKDDALDEELIDRPRGEHIFLRARRKERFRWRFPTDLFDNITFYILIRHPWVEMGINDEIQCGEGWFPLEAHGGKNVRRIRGVAQGFLKSPPGQLTFGIELYVAPTARPLQAQIIVWDRWLGRIKEENVYVDQQVTLEPGKWQRLHLPLVRHPQADDEVEVRLSINGDARANPPVFDPDPAEQGVAVHRFWYDAVPAEPNDE